MPSIKLSGIAVYLNLIMSEESTDISETLELEPTKRNGPKLKSLLPHECRQPHRPSERNK